MRDLLSHPILLFLLCIFGISHPSLCSSPLQLQATILLRLGEFTTSSTPFSTSLARAFMAAITTAFSANQLPAGAPRWPKCPASAAVPQRTQLTPPLQRTTIHFHGLHTDFYFLAATPLKCHHRLETQQQ